MSGNMEHLFFQDRIGILKCDITRVAADAIVNAANQSLLGGGGVDGAIHRAAGPQLLLECLKLGGCHTGDAKITKGYRLPAGHVIHTVGPVWHGGTKDEASLLSSCYQRCLEIAREHRLNSIAFPSISTGVYRYPKEDACGIALNTTLEFVKENTVPERILFVLFSEGDFEIYLKRLEILESPSSH
ncbi:MAG: O-acetyl-ADP-ribose deacetylase [bacterium]